MREEEFDAQVRQALHDDPWEPDTAAAELEFTRRLAEKAGTADVRPLGQRFVTWVGAAPPGLGWAAAAAAVVALALVIGPTLTGQDTLAERRDSLASDGGAGPAPTLTFPAPSTPPAGPNANVTGPDGISGQAPAPPVTESQAAVPPPAAARAPQSPAGPPARAQNPTERAPAPPVNAPTERAPAPPVNAPTERAPAPPVNAPTAPDPAPQPAPPAGPAPLPAEPPAGPAPLPAEPPAAPDPSPQAQPYTAAEVCGPGFVRLEERTLPRSVVYLLWNRTTKQNCVVTLKTANVGEPTPTTAVLRPDGTSETRDSGDYRYYANVTASAPGCIQWGGSDGLDEYTSPPGVRCSS